MKLEKLLREKKPDILKKWFDVIIETYPSNTSEYLKKQKNQFRNPVGHAIAEGLEHIFDELLEEVDSGRVAPFLDNIIRVRAVQDFTPSQAVSFVFSLKKIIAEEIKNSYEGIPPFDELSVIESRIDLLALLSFDIFMKCREKLYDIKATELRNMTFRLLQRVNMMDQKNETQPS